MPEPGAGRVVGKSASRVIGKALERGGVRKAGRVTTKKVEAKVAKKTTFGKGVSSIGPVKTTFGTGKGQHVAEVTVTRADGTVVKTTERSGNMTDAEKALGFPRSTLATHTEARATAKTQLGPGDHMQIDGQYPPCSSCKGKMNNAKTPGSTVSYTWPGGEWHAKGRKR